MAAGTRVAATGSKPVSQPGAGERRACPECGERLSAYNPGPHCYAHTVGVPWKGPTQRR